MPNTNSEKREVAFVPSSGQRLTTTQVARKYQVTPRTVQSWRDEGRIPFIRINSRCIRYDEGEIDRALANAT